LCGKGLWCLVSHWLQFLCNTLMGLSGQRSKELAQGSGVVRDIVAEWKQTLVQEHCRIEVSQLVELGSGHGNGFEGIEQYNTVHPSERQVDVVIVRGCQCKWMQRGDSTHLVGFQIKAGLVKHQIQSVQHLWV